MAEEKGDTKKEGAERQRKDEEEGALSIQVKGEAEIQREHEEEGALSLQVSVQVSHCKANGHFACNIFSVASCCNMPPCTRCHVA